MTLSHLGFRRFVRRRCNSGFGSFFPSRWVGWGCWVGLDGWSWGRGWSWSWNWNLIRNWSWSWNWIWSWSWNWRCRSSSSSSSSAGASSSFGFEFDFEFEFECGFDVSECASLVTSVADNGQEKSFGCCEISTRQMELCHLLRFNCHCRLVPLFAPHAGR